MKFLTRFALSRTLGRGLDVRPSRRQKRTALFIAAAADLAQLALAPLFGGGALSPFDDLLDAAVAVALVFTLGLRWRLAVALALELVPGLALFPSWTAVVATMSTAPENAVLVRAG
jgi:hypothetical protein